LLNAAYFSPVVYHAFFGKQSESDLHHHFHEAPLVMLVPLFTTAVISLIIGLYPNFFMSFVKAVLIPVP